MKDYKLEIDKRVTWIKKIIADSGAKGIIFGNSGGKDSALVGILCKMAADNVLGVIMPCGSKQNYGADKVHAELLAEKFGIESMLVDLTKTKEAYLECFSRETKLSPMASHNINPRLRMTTLYAIGQSKGYLVAGTGNASEAYTGYFTKWGDGAYDFNPIADILATEVFDFLRYLGAPDEIVGKPPSAGLFDGQTDEGEMGVSYAAIDEFIRSGRAEEADRRKIEQLHKLSEHKRKQPHRYGNRF